LAKTNSSGTLAWRQMPNLKDRIWQTCRRKGVFAEGNALGRSARYDSVELNRVEVSGAAG